MPVTNAPQVNKIVEVFKENFDFLISSQLQRDVFFLKLILIFLSLLFLVGIIYLLVKTDWWEIRYGKDLEDIRAFKDYGAKKWQRRWNKIKKRFAKETETHYKLALIEAEKFLDDILTKMGCGEGDLSEKLKGLAEQEVSNLRDVLEAHQVCQDIIRDPDYRLNKEKAEEVIDIFEKALSELQVL